MTSLDVFGQNPRLHGLYTQLCFAFALRASDASHQEHIVQILQSALDALAERLPWAAADVSRDTTGRSKLQHSRKRPILIVKHLEAELPTFEVLREKHFPFLYLSEETIAPRPTLPKHVNDSHPVFLVQPNFVKGGLLLVFNAQHNCLDFRGQVQVIEYFSRLCRSGSISDEELAMASVSGAHFQWLKASEWTKAGTQLSPNGGSRLLKPREFKESSMAAWSYFIVSSQALSRLKSLAESTITTEFVSTDDVLCAIVWQATLRARRKRLSPNDKTSTFNRQVDARAHVGIPACYTGNMVWKSQVSLPLDEVTSLPLGELASHLRRALSPKPDINEQTRATAAKLQDELASNGYLDAAPRRPLPATDVTLSSWAKENCHAFDFGPELGRPVAVRRPAFDAYEGLVYFMPKAANGEIAVGLCLKDDSLAKIRADDSFGQFCEFVG